MCSLNKYNFNNIIFVKMNVCLVFCFQFNVIHIFIWNAVYNCLNANNYFNTCIVSCDSKYSKYPKTYICIRNTIVS